VFKTGTWYRVQAGFEVAVLLPQPPECLDYRCEPPWLALFGLSSWRNVHSSDSMFFTITHATLRRGASGSLWSAFL
jgi:hypothetical protein